MVSLLAVCVHVTMKANHNIYSNKHLITGEEDDAEGQGEELPGEVILLLDGELLAILRVELRVPSPVLQYQSVFLDQQWFGQVGLVTPDVHIPVNLCTHALHTEKAAVQQVPLVPLLSHLQHCGCYECGNPPISKDVVCHSLIQWFFWNHSLQPSPSPKYGLEAKDDH